MNKYDSKILQRILAQDAAIGGVFNTFIKNISKLLQGYNYSTGGVWVNNSLIELKVDLEVETLRQNLEKQIQNNQQWAWIQSNAKNDELVNEYIKGLAITEKVKSGMFAQNLKALEQFQARKVDGFTVSDRVWNISKQAKTQLEFYLESGIGTGRSAATLSRDIRQLLNEPDKLFRRVRNSEGKLVPSKPMANYHPGQGVYKSAAKNALRLSASEINLAYRGSDYERWNQLDFVTGIEVKLSAAHPTTDICDYMKGVYPKDFKFTGWHPFCICFAVPILLDKDDFLNSLDMNEVEQKEFIQSKSVTEIPKEANGYLVKNQKVIDGWSSKPLWVRDNFKKGKIAKGFKFTS